MEQIFLHPSSGEYRINPIISTDLAVALRWILLIQKSFYKYRTSKVLELMGLDENDAENIMFENSSVSYDTLIKLIDDYIQSTPAIALDNNIQEFGRLIGLTQLEIDIFRFVLIQRTWIHVFKDVGPARFYNCRNDTYELLAHCINADAYDVEVALLPTSTLILCGLVSIGRGTGIDDLFRTKNVFVKLFSATCAPKTLLEQFAQAAEQPVLTDADFPHLGEPLRLMQTMLSFALSQKQVGCNFLIYGPAGTGKTEIARWLGYKVSKNVMGVSAFADHEAYDAKARLNAMLMCQKLYSISAGQVIIFDEADDVMPSQSGIDMGHVDAQKMALNQILETNNTPCIWICNSIRHFDAAQLRRFSQILFVDVPPQQVRLSIAKSYLEHTGVSHDYISALAADEGITPALLARLATNHQVISDKTAEQKQRDFDLMLNPILKARFNRPRRDIKPSMVNPAFYNSNICMAELAEKFKVSADLRLCIYGPPGTGKTSYANYLASYAQIPLIQKAASDLLGCYVGDTEKAIASAFTEAADNGAILLLDEVDNYLSQRQKAERHWEKSLTNELLMQIDRYQGALVCTTNFFEMLDPAAVRRFDLKIQLDYLTAEQARQMMQELNCALGLPQSSTSFQQLDTLKLTPADFSLIKRQMRLCASKTVSSDTIFQALQAEAELRQQVTNVIGFVH